VVDRSKNRWVDQHFQTELRSTLQVPPAATLPHHILGHENWSQVPRVSNHQRAKCKFVVCEHIIRLIKVICIILMQRLGLSLFQKKSALALTDNVVYTSSYLVKKLVLFPTLMGVAH
jgi:hypothetical protein